MNEASTTNDAQREYWNNVAGPRWVGLAGYVEKRVERVNDLLLARSAVRPGEKVLEVGCGTGAATVPLAEAVGETGEVVGIDISEPMLTAARQRISQRDQRNISLLHGDAQVYSFPPDHYDLIASRFGVMFFADPVMAFQNLRGATRPGGRLCFACWAALDENRHWLIPCEVALRHLGPPAPKPPRAPGPLAFSEPDYVLSVLEGAGYEGIEIRRETPDIIAASSSEEAEHACLMGPSGRLMEEKKPRDNVRDLIKREMTEAFAAYVNAGEMVLPSTIFLVTARRSATEIPPEAPQSAKRGQVRSRRRPAAISVPR